jgi:hypothetical protein
LWIERGTPAAESTLPPLEDGALAVVVLFIVTITLTVSLHSALHVPPAVGMMLGLGLLKGFAYVARRRHVADAPDENEDLSDAFAAVEDQPAGGPTPSALDIFRQLERVEWDTLLFFYGVLLCVGGLGTLGYLALASRLLYTGLGPTAANVLVGALSAIVDNVPVMFAVLSMNPEMSHGQWLLVTLTAGVGGSMLSIGSAAGVALMGLARGAYTFGGHLRWAWTIVLGYAASIAAHLLLNRHLF